MANWNFDPTQYEENAFAPIPAGDHRVRIFEVVEKKFSSGNEGFEITLEVSGHSGKLWYYLVLNPADPKKTNQRLGSFFDSFGITDYNLDHYKKWEGKLGAVRVKHEEYNGANTAKVAFCLSRKNQDKLPAWQGGAAQSASGGDFESVEDDDLPF